MRRRGVSDPTILGSYLMGAGTLRFFIEFVRVNERVAFGLSVAHFISLAAIAPGIALFVTQRSLERRPMLNSTRS
jgi:prolipoprotein diacylglyceryltransferase